MAVAQDMAFWLLSVLAIGSALGVVLVKDLFRSALLLALVFITVAGFYVLMSAEFLAVVQVLIYVGAILVLFVFGIMLTRNVKEGNPPNRLQIPAVLFPSLLLVGLIAAAMNTDWREIGVSDREFADAAQTQAVAGSRIEPAAGGMDLAAVEPAGSSVGLAELLTGSYALPFEAVSLLLLAALIGGLALARSRGN